MDLRGSVNVAALGRPFSLGMLYDCRTDSLIPGMTLWDSHDLMKNVRERPQTYNDFEIVASETTEDKSSALNVEAPLKASFLCGLVEVEGSAKYLKDNKTSKNQARVTLKYKTTTRFQELSMDHLGKGNVKHPYVFDQGIATHVVTGILYGAQAFFVFDREVSQAENHQDIQGNLKVMIKKIPHLAIEGEGSLQMEDKDKENADKFSCKFHGDFCLRKTPTCFQDAIEVYQSLPTLLGASGENAVPVKVWLLPLAILNSSAAKLVREISIRLVQEAQCVLEDLSELDMRCNDAMTTTTAQQFPQICKDLRSYKEMCTEFKLGFQQTLARKLPSIRGGGEEEAELAGILKKRHSSPFNSKNLSEWMDCKEREIDTVSSLSKKMKNTQIIPSQNHLYRESFNVDQVLCYVFTSLGEAEPYLFTLSSYLKEATPDEQDSHTRDVHKEQWYASKELTDEMRTKAKLFSDFAEANKENKNIKFLTVGLTNEKHKGSTIYLYKEGFPVSEDFELPSKPEIVAITDINHNSATLKISPPRFGAENISSYYVEYCVSGEDEWQRESKSKAEEVTVSSLTPNTEYVFRSRAVTSAGVGPANELSDSIKTLPCSPPGKPHVKSSSCEISVCWEKPAELGQDVVILSYIVEYAKTDKLTEEALQWKEMMSTDEKAIIEGLQNETEYEVRVRCDCGVDGRSKESVTVNIQTHLAEYLKHISKAQKSTFPPLYELPLEEEDLGINGCKRYNFGKESMRENRTIMLLGATGSGKSTLINAMINHIVGVEWEDNFRFQMVTEDQSTSQGHSQTSKVTVYKINHQEGFQIPFSLTIVDTPGFGDTGGINGDREVIEQLRNLFSADFGVSEIDAICFVVQARLTSTPNAFDSVFSIFGKDVAENIRILVTFADGERPPVLEAINTSGVPCPKTEKDGLSIHFNFNNSALFSNNQSSVSNTGEDGEDDSEEGGFTSMFWEMGMKSMKRFFTGLNLIHTRSLKLTEEVLLARQRFETSVENLQVAVNVGIAKLEEIRETRQKLKEHEVQISRNKDFQFTVTVKKPYQDTSRPGRFFNCQQCNYTCCENISFKLISGFHHNPNCTECPGRCCWSVHQVQGFRWIYREEQEKRIVVELWNNFQKATGEKRIVQGVIKELEEEYKRMQADVVALIDKSVKCLNRLKEISLKPNPLSTPEYIDMLIEGEIKEGKEGWKEQIQALQDMKEKAEIMSKVEKGEMLLPHLESLDV